MSDDEFEYEEAPWDSEEEEEAAAAAAPPQPKFATGVLRDGRRFAAVFCSPTVSPLHFWAEAQEMLDAGVLSSDANLSQGATLEAVEKLLQDYDPHVLWFVGHGDAALSGDLTLGWTTADGGLVLIDPRVCSAKLRSHTPRGGGSLECVVLNACRTMKDDSALGPCARIQTGTCLQQLTPVRLIADCCMRPACRSWRAGARSLLTLPHPSSRAASSKHCNGAQTTPRLSSKGSLG